MVDFCNPGVLGPAAGFRRYFEAPILAGREPGAAGDVAGLGAARAAELSSLVNHFILRRTNGLLSAHLPPKLVAVVCCRMAPLQAQLYGRFLESKAAAALFACQRASRVLSAITSLRKLLTHPKSVLCVWVWVEGWEWVGVGGGGGGCTWVHGGGGVGWRRGN